MEHREELGGLETCHDVIPEGLVVDVGGEVEVEAHDEGQGRATWWGRKKI